jgi:glutamyl-tRNA synthetase
MLFYAKDPQPGPIPPEAVPALKSLKARLETVAWDRAAINGAIKETLASAKLKMPQLAMPLRQVVTGRTQTPSIDAVLELLGRETVLKRLERV